MSEEIGTVGLTAEFTTQCDGERVGTLVLHKNGKLELRVQIAMSPRAMEMTKQALLSHAAQKLADLFADNTIRCGDLLSDEQKPT